LLKLHVDACGKLTSQLYDKWREFNFVIVNFPYTYSNIPLSYAHGVHIFLRLRGAVVRAEAQRFDDTYFPGLIPTVGPSDETI
jgi:hypothetical protein